MKKLIRKIFNSFGIEISRYQAPTVSKVPVSETLHQDTTFPDISGETKQISRDTQNYTLISLERMNAVVTAVDYIVKNNIPGDFAECGVWKGGSVYAVAKALAARNVFDRKLYLFDAFDSEAMGKTDNETVYDKDFAGNTVAAAKEKGLFVQENYNYQIADVQKLLSTTGYPQENIIFKVGYVEKTLPATEISKLAYLRLDTDWYESTKHELVHLYPKLVNKGVLLIDDYGYWEGCKQAVDEYITEHNLSLMLHRTDNSGRTAIKA